MADLGYYDDKLLKDNDQQTQNQAPITGTGTSGVISGGQTGQVSTGGVGAGGTGGWTNIQAYLKANDTNTGSANALDQKLGTQLNKEQNDLTTQSTQAQTQAQGEANKAKEAKDNAKSWINQSANAYNYSGQQTDPYKQNVQKVQNVYSGNYQGPKQFSYSLGADTQKLGDSLGDNGAFQETLSNLYKERTGGKLSSGQAALQNQFDVNSQSLADTRQNLLSKYAGLKDTLGATLANTNNVLSSAEQDYRVNQNALKDSISQYANEYEKQVGDEEALARNKYQGAMRGDKLSTTARFGIGDPITTTLSPEETLALAQRWQYDPNNPDSVNANKNAYDALMSNYNSWNNSQYNSAYNTADEAKKNWNVIQSILGQENKAKKQGFDVRS